jgi:tetrapyrrole methylase family protein/MazG family protein
VDLPRPHITVVGLGPAGTSYLSPAVLALIDTAAQSFLRTTRHPAAEDRVESFDHLYESEATFEGVYRAIVEELVAAATTHAPDPVVYAVPGSPLVAERTVELLRADERVDVTVVPGLSFLDLAWERLGIDPLGQGVRLVDAERFGAQSSGQRGPFLVAQCWSPTLLSDIKLSVPTDDDGPLPRVTILHHLGLSDEQVLLVDWWELDRTLTPDHLTSLYIPDLGFPALAEQEMARLEALVLTLRARCPWDQVQTHGSLTPHLVEEAYEVLDALSSVVEHASEPSYAHLEEELGDLLFQIVFHACLAQEAGRFTLADVARGVHDKLVHRHPHVFADVEAATSDQVVANWEEIKKDEKGRASVTEGIPSQLPALMLATKLQRKALAVGLPPRSGEGDLSDLVDELRREAGATELGDSDAPLSEDVVATAELVGELLFEVADLARRTGIDPEQALRQRALLLRERIVAEEGQPRPPNS